MAETSADLAAPSLPDPLNVCSVISTALRSLSLYVNFCLDMLSLPQHIVLLLRTFQMNGSVNALEVPCFEKWMEICLIKVDEEYLRPQT